MIGAIRNVWPTSLALFQCRFIFAFPAKILMELNTFISCYISSVVWDLYSGTSMARTLLGP